jgi:hypothetical protein
MSWLHNLSLQAASLEQGIFSAYPHCPPVFQFLLALCSTTPRFLHIINTLNLTVMKNFKKNYLGKGRQSGKMDIVFFTVSLKALQEAAHEFNGEMYVSFEISKLKEPDQFGKTHTMYQLVKDEEAVQEPEAQPTKTGKPKKEKVA